MRSLLNRTEGPAPLLIEVLCFTLTGVLMVGAGLIMSSLAWVPVAIVWWLA